MKGKTVTAKAAGAAGESRSGVIVGSHPHQAAPDADSPDADSREWGRVHGFTAENVDAVLKSAEILSRGFCAFKHNWLGATCMSIDDGKSAARALMGCATVPHLIHLQADLIKLNSSRATIRALLLSVMTVQVTEETLFPLIRRVDAAFGLFAGTRAA